MKPAEYLFYSLRREIALYICDYKYQNTEQSQDFYRIIEEELQTAAELAAGIKTADVQQGANQPVQPFHAEYLVLNKAPHFYSSPPSISATISAAALTISGHSVPNRPFDLA